MAEKVINLDRGVNLKIIYPIGVKETIEFVYNFETLLTDTYEVLMSSSKSERSQWKKISEGAELSKATNILTWIVNFEHTEIQERTYYYQIRNITQDYIEFKGDFVATKTIIE